MAEGEAVAFQTFDDADVPEKDKRKHLARILHGTIDDVGDELHRLNKAGAGIYWMVNYGDGRGRQAGNVTGVRCVFVDTDGAPLQPILDAGLTPHAVVQSSPGKWHVYWQVSDCTREQFTIVQKALAAKFGTDVSVNDLPRVLRVPGFLHRKAEPTKVQIIAMEPMQPYAIDEIVTVLQLDLAAVVDRRVVDPDTGEITVQPSPGEHEFADKVRQLGRRLRSGDGRREMLKRFIASRSARGLRPDDIRITINGIAALYFDPSDPIDEANIIEIVEHFAVRDINRQPPVINIGSSEIVRPDGSVEELLPPDLSDDALALELVQRGGDEYRWSPGLGWMVDAGIVWRRDEQLTRYDLARRICRAAALGAKGDPERKRLASAKTVAAVLSLAQSDQRIVVPAAVWDADPMLLNTPAGIVDLRSGELRPRRSSDYVTQAARVAPDFNRQAPVFQRFMLDVFGGDAAMVEFMQRALGYTLSGNTREQILMFWHGSGANGKSTLLDLVHWLLDSYGIKLPSAALMVQRNERHPTDIASLRGRRLAVSSELDEGQFWNEALIKELTGDEVLTARFMRQDSFQFKVTHKHVIVGNHKPRLRSADHAIARRMVLVPFVQKFEGQRRDKAMPDKLKAEAPAILAWMVRGAVKWYADGLGIPDAVRSASAEYISEHDDLALWMDECCVRIGEAKASELYQSFNDWKRQRGEHATSATTWFQRLQAVAGIRSRRSNGIRYEGIALNEAEAYRMRYAER
jgi:putative DNA primase/helicase